MRLSLPEMPKEFIYEGEKFAGEDFKQRLPHEAYSFVPLNEEEAPTKSSFSHNETPKIVKLKQNRPMR